MKKLLILSLLVLSLSGCKPTDEEVAKVSRDLPVGCSLKDFGSYGSIDNLVVVICDGRRTTTTNTQWSRQCGKTRCSREAAAALIEY